MSMRKIKGAVIILILLILLGGGIYSYIEGWNLLDSIYFTVVTVTTLGYGDFFPVTDAGKIFTIFFSLSGIAIAIYILGVMSKYVSDGFYHRNHRKIVEIKNNKIVEVKKNKVGKIKKKTRKK